MNASFFQQDSTPTGRRSAEASYVSASAHGDSGAIVRSRSVSLIDDTNSQSLSFVSPTAAAAAAAAAPTAPVSQWTQTELSLPPVLPRELEEALARYYT